MGDTNGNGNGDGDQKWERKRKKILFYAGLGGFFIYLSLVEFLRYDFQIVWVLAFMGMMGLSIASGVDKK